MRFSSLQYLTIHPIARKTDGNTETLTVQLKNYVLLSPEAINLTTQTASNCSRLPTPSRWP